MSNDSLKPLHTALNKRLDEGNPVEFWLRDDDAVEPTAALDRLLQLTDQYAVPVTLAVIPAIAVEALARRLASTNRVKVAVHGWSHQNHALQGEKKQELGLHRPIDTVLADLEQGYRDLSQRYGAQFVPLLVPPWNRIDPTVVTHLPTIGFQGLSTFSDQTSDAIPVMNTHVDVINWKGSRGGKSTPELVDELVGLVEGSQMPIGILTHHLVHDDQVWRFLDALFSTTSSHAGACWLPIDALLPALSPHPRFPRQ